jgi:hypothetical protein
MAFADAQSGGLILNSTVPIEITLAGACVKGDLLGYSSGWKRSLGDVAGVIQAKCVAGMDGKSGEKIVAYFGKVLLGGRLTGMTIGNPLYADEGSANGKITDTAPSDQNDSTKIVGVAVSATVALIDCNMNADILHA